MTTQLPSKERLADLAAFKPSGANSIQSASRDEWQAMACALLAAYEQEPVAWIYEDELPANYPYDAMFPYSKVDIVRMFPVFAPSIPAVPEGYKLVPIDPTKDMLRAGQSVVGFWLNTLHCYAAMLSAAPDCRAAMLQAEPVSQPYKLPDGWIPVSDRMPERGIDVLACKMNAFGGYDEIEAAQWHGGMRGEQPVFITSADTIEPELWQPLPAPPKE